jgi:choline kinase
VILQRQLDSLRAVLGADLSVTAVVGFRSEMIMRAAPDLLFTFNPEFATTNTSESLLRGLRTSREGGVLWLNGDVVFDPAALQLAVPSMRADQSSVCVDTSAVADEEVKYTVGEEGDIRELSRNAWPPARTRTTSSEASRASVPTPCSGAPRGCFHWRPRSADRPVRASSWQTVG